MINGGHDNSLQILEEDHQWRKGIFQQDSQGTNSKEPRESQRSKNMFWLSRNASWTWIMIICGMISPVEGTGSFSLWLLNADLKTPLGTLRAHNCKGLDSATALIHPSLSQSGCSLQLSLLQGGELGIGEMMVLVKILHSCVSPCAVCHLGIHQTEKETIAAVREVLLLLEGCGESLGTCLTTACR